MVFSGDPPTNQDEVQHNVVDYEMRDLRDLIDQEMPSFATRADAGRRWPDGCMVVVCFVLL